jgi:acetyltransferase-like isoleucine patch superfamily enzyme
VDLLRTLRSAKARWDRDAKYSFSTRLEKSTEYALSLMLANWYLRNVSEVGTGVRVIDRPRIKNRGTMTIGRGSILRSVVVPVELVVAYGATLNIGERCSINYGASIGASGSITLGNRVRIGPYAMIIDCLFHDLYDRDQCPQPKPVVIEDDVWISAKASVMPGVRIGRGSIAGAHAVVTKDVPPFTVVAGIPARPIAKLDENRFVVQDL